ncbi:hypothetical protein [Nocardia salmonicida]|uniref:hypothetical protein n=1 Tax=Nocardia salmonicida TaxID=53431 RepID=UPI0007A476FD|nr:hypothetical protein [Nocardia salmonicida]
MPLHGDHGECASASSQARILLRTVLQHRRIATIAGPMEPPRRHTGLSPADNARITLLPR